MRRLAVASILIGFFSTASCSEGPVRTVELRVSSTDPGVIARTDEVLLSRFSMFNSARFTPITSRRDGDHLIYSFPGENPSDATIEFLSESIGLITLTLAEPADSDPVITSYDIERIDARRDDAGNELLFFELTPSAGELMLRTTADNIGNQMVLKVDDAVLMEATIRGVFARQFQLAGSDLDDFQAVHALTRFGPLPASVEVVSFDDAP